MPTINKRFIGGMAAVAQVDTLTPGGTIEAGDLFKITLTDERGDTYTLSVAATATSVAQTCQDIITAFNACGDPRFTRITAAGVGTVGAYTAVTLTADTAGEPFTCTVTTTESNGDPTDGQTFARAATTASSGAYDYNLTGNWLGGVLPVSGDEVLIDAPIKYGLAGHSAVVLDYLKITKQCGQYPAAGMLGAYLTIGATIVDIDATTGPILVDTGTGASTITVYNSPAASYSGVPVVWIKANKNSTDITVRKGVVGIGFGDGETTTIRHLDVLYTTQKTTDATVYTGDGVTFDGTPVINHKGGYLYLRSAATVPTINSDDGYLATEGSFAVTALTIKRSTVVSNSTGKVTTANIEGTGTLDTTKSNTAREVETVHLHSGATYKKNSCITTDTITFEESMSISAQAA